MGLSNYSELKTSIENWLDDSDLANYLDDFISLGEEKINSDLRVREMQSRETALLKTDSRFLAYPTDYLEMLRFRLNTSPVSTLTFTNRGGIDSRHNTQPGKPKWFTDVDGQLEFERIADQAYTGEMVFYKKVSALSASNTTNDILTNYPGVYLFACISEADDFVSDDKIMLWESKYQSYKDRANKIARRQRTRGAGIVQHDVPIQSNSSYNVDIE